MIDMPHLSRAGRLALAAGHPPSSRAALSAQEIVDAELLGHAMEQGRNVVPSLDADDAAAGTALDEPHPHA